MKKIVKTEVDVDEESSLIDGESSLMNSLPEIDVEDEDE